MNSKLKERILAFSDLGTLFYENFNEKKVKTFPKWNSLLAIKLNEANLFNPWFTTKNLKLTLKNWSELLNEKK